MWLKFFGQAVKHPVYYYEKFILGGKNIRSEQVLIVKQQFVGEEETVRKNC